MAYLELSGLEVNCIESEGTWIYEKLPALLTVDKVEITAGGLDTAAVTAEVHPDPLPK